MSYEQLLDEANKIGIKVKEKPLQSSDGRIYYDRIAIRKDIPTVKKTCVLAEELGHYFTTEGNILDQENLDNAKQEHRARVWAYNKLLSADQIVEAAAKGHTEVWDMAEYLDVDEEFLRDYLVYQGILDIYL